MVSNTETRRVMFGNTQSFLYMRRDTVARRKGHKTRQGSIGLLFHSLSCLPISLILLLYGYLHVDNSNVAWHLDVSIGRAPGPSFDRYLRSDESIIDTVVSIIFSAQS